MKKFLILAAFLFAFDAFSQETKCDKFHEIATKTIAITLNCRAEASIKLDVQKFTHSLGACPQPEDKGLVCFVVAKAGVYLVQKQIPRGWMCKPEIAMKVLEVGLNKVCFAITGM